MWTLPLIATLATAQAQPRLDHPGQARIGLFLAGGSALALGTVWFFDGGRYPGAGDGAAVLMGAGFLGLAGSTLGAGGRALSRSEDPFDDRVSSPLLATQISPWGSSTLGQTDPATATLSAWPRVGLGSRLRLTAGGTLRRQLGPAIAVDPTGAGDPILSSKTWGADLGWRIRGFPGSGADRTTGWNQIEFIAGSLAQLRWDHHEPLPEGNTRGIRRLALIPLAIGARWNLSERQRYEVVFGPRLDRIGWNDGASGPTTSGPLVLGPVDLRTHYDVQIPHPQGAFGLLATSRLRLSYASSHFDGAGIDPGAAIGYLGALGLGWDTEWRRSAAGWALWTGISATWTEDSGVFFTLGVTPPRTGP